MSIYQNIYNHIKNVPGWRTDRKIVVIESDDWGSIRMPSRDVYNKLLEQGYRVDLHPYEKYDSLESEEDLIALFEVLIKHKDKNGNHPVFTANGIIANPDFIKIKESYFQEYFYEPFTITLQKYNYNKSFRLWEQGYSENIFIPQFHGREHLNVATWMIALQNNDKDIRSAFEYGLAGIFPKNDHKKGNQTMAALRDTDFEETSRIEIILKDGLNLFEKIFGYRSITFMAPCYTWRPEIEKTLMECGIQAFQGALRQIVPGNGNITHWMGSKNKYGQYYLVRNCYFEPTTEVSSNVKQCITQIERAFQWKKPAIISSHRINYIGSIFRENRENNLVQLNLMLTEITKRWPEVEFISSDQLVNIIKEEEYK